MIRIDVFSRETPLTVDRLAEENGNGITFAADFYVEGAESWTPEPGGLRHPDLPVVNVDHHAPLPAMRRPVSSANLAIERVAALGLPDPAADRIVLNHLDCDSVLAAGILSGRLEPLDAFGRAAIAADHTGDEDPIADLLQGLDAHWSRTGRPTPDAAALDYFLEMLSRHLAGQPLDAFGEEALRIRRTSRERARALLEQGRAIVEDGVVVLELDEPIEGELFLPHIPDALVFATLNPHRTVPDRLQAKIRLGPAAPEGASLHDLDIPGFDPAFGGRWNAGSNRSGGGYELGVEDYRRALVGRVVERFGTP